MKRAIVILAVLSISIKVQAQELSIKINTGVSGLQYTPEKGTSERGIGSALGINYTYFLNKNWGIISGLELSSYQSDYTATNDTFTSYEVDESTSAFEYRVQTKGYKEKQKLRTLNIPLLLQYKKGSTAIFYINGGFKFFLPISQSVESSSNNLALSGYYPHKKLLINDLKNRGFGELSQWSNEDETSTLKMGMGLSLETGMSTKLGKGAISVGLYLDYGISNINKNTENKNIVSYGSKGIHTVKSNSILQTKNIESIKLLSFGMQVKYAFVL